MRRFGTLLLLAILAGSASAITGCSRSTSAPEFGTFGLQMTDAPGDFEAVNLVIEEVAIHRDGGEGSGWEVLNATPGTYDLIKLTNGVFAELALSSVPAGTYTQVRLMIGEGSTVVVDGVTHPLAIPSGLRTGLKLTGTFEVPPGGGFDLGLDFDAARSIVTTGNGTWTLQPTVRVMPLEGAGAVSGAVWPGSVPAEVVATQGGTMVAGSPTAVDGSFQISMLPPGVYDITVNPYWGWQPATVTGVVVTAGGTTDVGTIELMLGP